MQTKRKTGVIAIIDALGTKTNSLESAEAYLAELDKIKSGISVSMKVMIDAQEQEHLKDTLKDLKVRFFGDLALLSLEIKAPEHETACLNAIAVVLSFAVIDGMESGILFRGAVAVGDYLESADAVLGPAVIDVANWYEKLDQVGVISTPKTALTIERIIASLPNDEKTDLVECVWYRHDFPLKEGCVDGYQLNWVEFGFVEHEGHWKTKYLKLLERFDQPLGTERKYSNTIKFIEEIIRNKKNKANKKMQ